MSTSTLRSVAGVDSLHLRYKHVFLEDIIDFCNRHGYKFEVKVRNTDKIYKRVVHIYLPDGKPVRSTYHPPTKTTKFEIGGLFDYSKEMNEIHLFLQRLVSEFSESELEVSRLDVAVDARHPLMFKKVNNDKNVHLYNDTTLYINKGKIQFVVYDKSRQLQLYSINHLTRYELRLEKLKDWHVSNFLDSKNSLVKLIEKVEKLFWEEYVQYFEKYSLVSAYDLEFNFRKLFYDFIEFIHGGGLPPFKDHHKVVKAIENRDRFFNWMREHGLKDIAAVKRHIKGKKRVACREIDVSDKTLGNIIRTYEGIPNFKVR